MAPDKDDKNDKNDKSDNNAKQAVMTPMFLPGVEHNPQPGRYRDNIRMMQASGAEYPQIWHLFAFLAPATEHLAIFTQAILRGPAPLSPGMRELIAAYTSYRNDCPF
jgi:hypothetical protein